MDFVHCIPTLARRHSYAIVPVEYFTKWAKEMHIFAEDGKTTELFIFNDIIARFGGLQAIVKYHGSHFQNHMMTELSVKLGF